MALRWDYHGSITVVLEDGTEVTGFGRLAQRTDDPGGWRAEVSRLPERGHTSTPRQRMVTIKVTTPNGDNGPQPPRGGRGRWVRTATQRHAEAVRLRSEGHTYEQIAAQLGYRDRASAYNAVQRTIASTVREPADELRQMELIRLDSLWLQAMQVLQAQHVTVSNGRVVTIEKDGEPVPVPDDAPVLQAIDRLLKIMERRSKLLGLDAPAKVEVMSLDRIDQAITELERELGEREAGEAAPPAGAAPAEG